MLTVSESALSHLSQLLVDRGIPDEIAIRCVIEGEELALVPDATQDEDVVFKHGERTVLIIEPELSEALDGREFDIETTDEGSQLTLRETE